MFIENETAGLNEQEIKEFLIKSFGGRQPGKVLLIPPDFTRLNSGAGIITEMLYSLLTGRQENTQVDILPALGTHVPMTRDEQVKFFGRKIPAQRFLIHNWRDEVIKIGEIPGSFVCDVSEGLMSKPIDVEVSNYLTDQSYNMILSIGQVVPHEVAGMANYTKNIVVGCGGSNFISSSHMLGAFYGIERIMGQDYTPVRRIFDYAQEHFVSKLGVEYILTVTVTEGTETKIIGLYTGKTRECFNRAVEMSRKHNICYVEKPIETCVVRLDESEYHSAWLGNKGIYRTRMAMADGGRLIILAPGVSRFGEDDEIDRIIRKYGYVGREKILELCKTRPDLRNNLSAAAHLIHGSSDGRFEIIYAARLLGREEAEGVGFKYMPYDEAVSIYNPENLKQGFNNTEHGEIYYIDNPALGLWKYDTY